MALRRAFALLVRSRESQLVQNAESLSLLLRQPAAEGAAIHRAASRERLDLSWQVSTAVGSCWLAASIILRRLVA